MKYPDYPLSPKFCYLALGYIRDQNAAIGLYPPFHVQMGLLGVAASLSAEKMDELADEIEFGKLQAESLVEARKSVEGLVQLANQTESEDELNTILAAARTIQQQAESTLWKLSKIEA